MSTDHVALELRGRTGDDMATAFRFIVDELLGFLQDVLTAEGDGPEHADLCAEVVRNRSALAQATDRRAAGALVEPLQRLCHAALERIRADRVVARTEMTSLVALVRDAVNVLAGEGSVFSASMHDSLRRVEDLSRVSNIHELKASLARELLELRELARHREEQSKRTFTQFEERVASLERQLDASKEEASVDPLTGAGNRRAFDRHLDESLRPGRRQFVLALIDLDDFKRINDTFGHEAGDGVLRTVADILKGSLRAEDLVARIGGDEFALIVSGLTLAQAENRLRSIAGTLVKSGGESSGVRFTVSCGASECSAGDTAESIVRRADQALYDAKRQGKNRVITYATPLLRDLRAS